MTSSAIRKQPLLFISLISLFSLSSQRAWRRDNCKGLGQEVYPLIEREHARGLRVLAYNTEASRANIVRYCFQDPKHMALKDHRLAAQDMGSCYYFDIVYGGVRETATHIGSP